jgi:hypothetical protein
MAGVAELSGAAILDTSWLLELYRVPGYSDEARTVAVRTETAEFIDAECELFVTVPVLFEVASHINHVRDGRLRRSLGERLLRDITSSIDREAPWTIANVGREILLRSQDVIRLARRFTDTTGPNYSFADISIIDLATELRQPDRKVKILAFDEQLRSYSD